MSNRYASWRHAAAICDICGFRYPRKDLRSVIIKGKDTNLQACCECWDPDHPQLHLGEFPVDDPQAIRNPRPTSPDYPESRAQIVQVYAQTGTGFVGSVTVSVVSPGFLLLESGLTDFLLQENNGRIGLG